MRSKHTGWHRHMRTTAERRANSDPELRKYVRGKRSPRMLPSYWTDRQTTKTKSWKDKRLIQYRPDGRGVEHEIHIGKQFGWGPIYRIEEYFKDHEIPFVIDHLYDTEIELIYGRWSTEVVGYEKYTTTRYIRDKKSKKKHKTILEYVTEWRAKYDRVWTQYDKPREVHYRHDKGYNVTWWSDKDIGIDRIIASSGCESY